MSGESSVKSPTSYRTSGEGSRPPFHFRTVLSSTTPRFRCGFRVEAGHTTNRLEHLETLRPVSTYLLSGGSSRWFLTNPFLPEVMCPILIPSHRSRVTVP